MNATAPKVRKADLPVVSALAELLERPDGKLANGAPGLALSVLPGSPAAADDRHENVNDQPARLCAGGFAGSNAAGQRGSGAGNALPMNRFIQHIHKEDPTHGKS